MDKSVSASHSSSRSSASNIPCALRTSPSFCAMFSEMNLRIVAMYAAVHSDVNLRVARARSTYSMISNGSSPRVDLGATDYGSGQDAKKKRGLQDNTYACVDPGSLIFYRLGIAFQTCRVEAIITVAELHDTTHSIADRRIVMRDQVLQCLH